MSQEDVMNVLEENGKLSAEEISELIESNTAAVRKCLNRLLKQKEVKKINLTAKQITKAGKSYSGRHFVWMLNKLQEVKNGKSNNRN